MSDDAKSVAIPQCKAHIWKPDTYRRTGRGPSGFEMHYMEMQCSRTARENGYCWQHQWLFERDEATKTR